MVPMDYTIDGSQLRTEFLLEKSGTEWLFFHNWSFVPAALPVLDVTVVNASEATLNGVPVNMPNGRNSFAVFYPGEYEASLNGEFFSAPPTKATLSGRDVPAAPLNLLTQATDGLKDAVSGKVKEFLDTCADAADKAAEAPAGLPVLPRHQQPGYRRHHRLEHHRVPHRQHRALRRALGGGAAGRQGPDQGTAGGSVHRRHTELNAVQDFSFTTRLDIAGDTIKVTPLLSY